MRVHARFCATSESDLTKEKIQKILASGANVVLTTKGIDDLCLKYFIDAGAMAVRRCKKEDLERIAKATGGTLISTLATLEGDEAFDAASLGYAEEVAQERISDDELVRDRRRELKTRAGDIGSRRGAGDFRRRRGAGDGPGIGTLSSTFPISDSH